MDSLVSNVRPSVPFTRYPGVEPPSSLALESQYTKIRLEVPADSSGASSLLFRGDRQPRRRD